MPDRSTAADRIAAKTGPESAAPTVHRSAASHRGGAGCAVWRASATERISIGESNDSGRLALAAFILSESSPYTVSRESLWRIDVADAAV